MNNTDHIKAKVILHSENFHTEVPIYTLELEYPRYIHAEFMTHRVFSRNAQSSRAIPVEKAIELVASNNWYPIFMENQKGMAASIPLEGKELLEAKIWWNRAKDMAIYYAKILAGRGVHKQIVNRILEPYSLIRVIITATDFDNFFKLRLAKDAQQEIQILAQKMKDAIDLSEPQYLSYKSWHLPYIFEDEHELNIETKLKLSAARCARVSYLSHDGKRDLQKDIDLHDQLLSSKHMSPFEHQACAFSEDNYFKNFRSFGQYRKMVE